MRGSHELVRLFPLFLTTGSSALKEMEALAEQAMADCDEDGWTHPAYKGPEDVSILGKG